MEERLWQQWYHHTLSGYYPIVSQIFQLEENGTPYALINAYLRHYVQNLKQ